ncbi:unnamed protein product, partial [Cladocopium goreaui]
ACRSRLLAVGRGNRYFRGLRPCVSCAECRGKSGAGVASKALGDLIQWPVELPRSWRGPQCHRWGSATLALRPRKDHRSLSLG